MAIVFFGFILNSFRDLYYLVLKCLYGNKQIE